MVQLENKCKELELHFKKFNKKFALLQEKGLPTLRNSNGKTQLPTILKNNNKTTTPKVKKLSFLPRKETTREEEGNNHYTYSTKELATMYLRLSSQIKTDISFIDYWILERKKNGLTRN